MHKLFEKQLKTATRASGEIDLAVLTDLVCAAYDEADSRSISNMIEKVDSDVAAKDGGELHQAQKMDAVAQLAGSIAHDFNNILTVITGTIEILTDSVADRPQCVAIAQMIDQAAGRGAELTRHLLAVARKQPLRPLETDVNALIVDSTKLLRASFGEHVEIEARLERDAWPALVDRSQLTTALLNLRSMRATQWRVAAS